jgi:multidrug resistance efflux pump
VDIKRDPPKKTKQYILGGVGLLVVAAGSLAITKLQPAAPTVERGTLWIDTVKHGDMVRSVNAPGTLMPEDIQIVSALTSGRVEQLPIQPGVTVTPSTLLVRLVNPDEQNTVLVDQQALNGAYSNLTTLKASLAQQELTQKGQIAQTQTLYLDAVRQVAVDDSLGRLKLVSNNDIAKAHDALNELEQRMKILKDQLAQMEATQGQQIALAEQQIDGLKRILDNQKQRVASMDVYAPVGGQLQMLGNPQLQLGQYVTQGTELARIMQPGRLKAVLHVADTQARDVVPGQLATIDLHNNTVVKGRVTRTDPSSQGGTITVEVAITDPLPKGTRSDIAVDGTIQIENLKNVLYVGRPGFGQPDQQVGIFKITPNKGEANRVNVQLGAASVSTIVVKNGLSVGDSVIISDMSQWDNVSRVRIK